MILAQAVEATAGGSVEFWLFLIVGAIALGSGIAVVLMRNAVHAALMLVVNLFMIALLFAILEAQFLFVAQVIVYAGAIMVLFLFVLMLLGVWREQTFTDRLRGQKTAAVTLGTLLFAGLVSAVAGPYLGPEAACNTGVTDGICQGLAEANADGNVRAVGVLLFTDYVWPFEVMSVLLVIAALGAMILGRRREDPSELVDSVVREPDADAGTPQPQPEPALTAGSDDREQR